MENEIVSFADNEAQTLINGFGKWDLPYACVIRDKLGEIKYYSLNFEERREIADKFIGALSDFPVEIDGVVRLGVKTRFERLVHDLKEIGTHNYVALQTRYFWDEQIVKILAGQVPMPTCLEIDLTTYCDSHCFFCKEGREKKMAEYPFKKLAEDLENFRKFPETKMVIYSGGGEPTCYSRFKEAMKLAHELGYTIYISTHGGQIGLLPQLPHRAFVDYATILKISIGGASHSTYNKVHNQGQNLLPGTPRTVNYIFQQLKTVAQNRRTVTTVRGPVQLPRLWVAMTLNPLNQDEVKLMADKAIQAGVNTLLLRPLITTHEALLKIEQGVQQVEEIRRKYSSEIEIMSFQHRLDYGYRREDYFGKCICHPVVNPDFPTGDKGSITPCIFRRGNRPGNEWLWGGDPIQHPLLTIIESEGFKKTVEEQNVNLHPDGPRRCPRCRKTVNNIFLDILFQASPLEKEIMRTAILILFPRTNVSEVIKDFY